MQPEHPDRNAISRVSSRRRPRPAPTEPGTDRPAGAISAGGGEQARFDAVYFLEAGIASITTGVRHEVPIEIGVVGREGVVNLPALMGIDRSPSETFMQIHGAGFRIGVKRLREAMAQSPTLMPILLRFVHVYMVQTASTVLANGSARIPERLARWWLMAADRVDGDGIAPATAGKRQPNCT